MPFPQNLETARAVEAIIRQGGAVPATVCVLGGVARVGVGLSLSRSLSLARSFSLSLFRSLSLSLSLCAHTHLFFGRVGPENRCKYHICLK